jgi:hypothetical protein
VEEALAMGAEDFRGDPDAGVEPLEVQDEEAGVEPLEVEGDALEEPEEERGEEEAAGGDA